MCCCCCCRCLSSLCCPCMSFPPPPSSSNPLISRLLLPPPPTAPVTQLVVIVLFPLPSSQKQTPVSLYFAEVFLLRLSTPKLLPKLRTKAAESKIRRRPVRHYHSPIIRKQNQKNLTSTSDCCTRSQTRGTTRHPRLFPQISLFFPRDPPQPPPFFHRPKTQTSQKLSYR
jgi:hypothetical protein